MGHCTSKDQKEGKRLNRRIDEQIKKDQSMSLRIIKLLLLERDRFGIRQKSGIEDWVFMQGQSGKALTMKMASHEQKDRPEVVRTKRNGYFLD
ncbi:hypothetical protein RB195_001813 [Necator americanus]|uniref:Uncharacterized protein n=1 Tax=Necator americanus TaxID=51031 RepID=A0ABR1DG19_NECAM